MFRVVNGKIVEEDEATFQERQKKMLEGIMMPVIYTCRLCNDKLCATTEEGLYRHWIKFHSDGNNDGDDTEDADGNSDPETEKTSDMFLPESSSSSVMHGVMKMKMQPGEEEEASRGKTISASPNSLDSDHEGRQTVRSRYYPKDIYIGKINVIFKNMDFKISASPDKRFPVESMQKVQNEIAKDAVPDSYDCVENLGNMPNLESSLDEHLHIPISENWGPMPTLRPECSPSPPDDDPYNDIDDAAEITSEESEDTEDVTTDGNDDSEDVTTDNSDDPENFEMKRKYCDLSDSDDDDRSKRHTKKTKQSSCHTSTRPNLYDAMRRGEKLWWCKKCNDYLESVELLKYHLASVHSEDRTKINRFNIATWDMEIARTFTSPLEIEREYEYDLLDSAN